MAGGGGLAGHPPRPQQVRPAPCRRKLTPARRRPRERGLLPLRPRRGHPARGPSAPPRRGRAETHRCGRTWARDLASASARRGASIARRRLGGFIIWIIRHNAVPSLKFGFVESFVGAAQEV